MPKLTLAFEPQDVDGVSLVDPTVFVRLARHDGSGSVEHRVAFDGRPLRVEIADGPSGTPLALRLIPSRYRSGGLLCSVDGAGNVTPAGEIVLPRSPAAWRPAFTGWQALGMSFDSLKRTLSGSTAFQLGRLAPPARLADAAYDSVDPDNESSVLAKMGLLNLHSRLSTEAAPSHGAPWFSLVDELLLATRERFIARVPKACFDLVHKLSQGDQPGYKKASPSLHVKNFQEIPGVADIGNLASVKTDAARANLQFTVAQVRQHGKSTFLLDTDIDENGRLVRHFFDLVKHTFNGGTDPIDVHECLRTQFPAVDIGYQVAARTPVAEVRTRALPTPVDVPAAAERSRSTRGRQPAPGTSESLGRDAVHTEVALQDREAFAALLSNKPLGDPSVGPALPGATIAAGQNFGGDVLSVNVHGTMSLRAFNSADDADEDGILGDVSDDLPVDALPPQIQLTDDAAYVKYRAEAGVRAAAAGTTLASLGFAIEGGIDLILTDYHRHPRTVPTRDAVLLDITKLRTSLRLDDVLALAAGEAVSQQVAGRLSASVELSWSDVFTGPIGPLSRLAGPGASVLVKVSAGATVKASVSLSDDFLLVFSRVDAQRWRVGLRKARTRAAAVGVDLGVSVEFADPAQVDAILGAAVEGVIGQPLDTLDSLLAKATLEELSATERALAERLIERFGLDRAIATLDALRQKIAEVRQRIRETIEAIAKAKVALGFGYEYRRMRQDTTVAQCTVTRAGLTKHHPALVRGQFGEVFAEAAQHLGGSALEHFFYQTTVKSERSWGFSLSIGKWVEIGGRDRKTLSRVDRHSATGTIQRAFVGTRGYRHQGEGQDRWSADLSASMAGYSRAATPLVSELETGLAFNWFDTEKKLDADTLSAWLDLGVLWGAVPEGDTARVREALAGALKKPCAVVAQLVFPHEAFSMMRSRIAVANVKDLGASLGAAMRWSSETGRQSVALRRGLYAALWEIYLSNPDHAHRPGREFAAMARQHLADRGFDRLGDMERLYAGTTRPHDENVFSGLIDLNPHTIQNCRDFFNGVKRLNVDVLSAAPDNGAIERVFEEMENLWRQEHHVRAVGAYLLDVARSTAVLTHVGRSLAITVGPATPTAEVFIVGS